MASRSTSPSKTDLEHAQKKLRAVAHVSDGHAPPSTLEITGLCILAAGLSVPIFAALTAVVIGVFASMCVLLTQTRGIMYNDLTILHDLTADLKGRGDPLHGLIVNLGEYTTILATMTVLFLVWIIGAIVCVVRHFPSVFPMPVLADEWAAYTRMPAGNRMWKVAKVACKTTAMSILVSVSSVLCPLATILGGLDGAFLLYTSINVCNAIGYPLNRGDILDDRGVQIAACLFAAVSIVYGVARKTGIASNMFARAPDADGRHRDDATVMEHARAE